MLKFDEFKRYIAHIKQEIKHVQALNDVCNSYDVIGTTFGGSILVDDMVDLLETLLKDSEGWINYWVFDLDFGEKYHKGCVRVDGRDIALETVDDLWRFINDLYKTQ